MNAVPLTCLSALLLAMTGLRMPGCAEDAGWSVPGDLRFLVTRSQTAPAGCTVASVRIYPQDAVTARSVVVTTLTGEVVPSRVVWSAPGTPVDVLFACQNAASSYLIYPSAVAPGAGDYAPAAGVVLETRQFHEGEVERWQQFKADWTASADAIFGRSVVTQIFDGIHRHGPSVDYMSWYHGYFIAPNPGAYAFATISDDGSFVFIDDAMVCSWPGYHGPEDGRRGEHQGSVSLAAGRHVVDYYHFQGGGGSIASLAWRPPGAAEITLMTPQDFVAVAPYAIQQVQRRAGIDVAAFSWEMDGHTTTGGEAGGPALVEVRLRLLDARQTHVHWTFDDGAAAEGAMVVHLFPRIGLRAVQSEVVQADGSVQHRSQRIAVHAQWLQHEDFPEKRWHAQRRELIGRDLSHLPIADFSALVDQAQTLDDLGLFEHLAAGALLRLGDFKGEPASCLLVLNSYFQRPEVRRYQDALQTLAALGHATDVPAAISAKARLHQAGLLLHGFFDAAHAQVELDSIAPGVLDESDRRLLAIYKADAQVVAGDVAAAARSYDAIGQSAAPGDVHSAVMHSIHLATAREYIKNHDYAAAEELLRENEWETPRERLGTSAGLLLVAIWRARQELPLAWSRCLFMRSAAPEDVHLPDVLLAMVQIQLANGDHAQARQIAQSLIADHPASEAAARAQDLLKDMPKDQAKDRLTQGTRP